MWLIITYFVLHCECRGSDDNSSKDCCNVLCNTLWKYTNVSGERVSRFFRNVCILLRIYM